jgi:hypothetical protein
LSVLRNAVDLRRWAELILLILRRVVYFQDFGLWLAAAVPAAIFFARRGPLSPPSVALLSACAAFATIYVLQPHELSWIFRTSADRLVVQMWPAAVGAAIPALRRYAFLRIDDPSTKG